MKSHGKIIYEVRMEKGISQEELAEMAKVNLRTIQRIENELTEPRVTTINLIYGVLEIDPNQIISKVELHNSDKLVQKLINVIFVILLNIAFASIIVYLTVYNNSTIYSRIGAFFLCILIPFFIVTLTRSLSNPIRLIKFGTGFILVVIVILFQVNIEKGLFSGAIPSSLLGLAILFYGNDLRFKKI